MNIRLEDSWKEALGPIFQQDWFLRLTEFVRQEYKAGGCYPPGGQIFRAFDLTPLPEVRVVILGQDPYHGPGQAHGLCFSVNEGVPFPPSLQNIFEAIRLDLGTAPPTHGNLERWARQGVLLLNTVLTVRARQAGSHQGQGWERFTDAVIRVVSEQNPGAVFLLWGSPAQKKEALIDSRRHLILKAPHPSPLSAYRGFMDCKHFSTANTWLQQQGRSPIVW